MKELIIEVATLCPNRCVHCSSECGFVADGNILFEEFTVLLSAARENGFDRIVFSGGEPLAFSLLPQCIAYAKANGFSTKIYTSGSGDKNVIASIFASGKNALPDTMVFSCYGDTPDINTAVTGNPEFLQNLRHMLSLTQKFGIRAELNFVPMKMNYLALEQTFFMFLDTIESFNILRLVKQGNAVENWQDIYVDDNELQPILKKLSVYGKLNIGRSFQIDSLPSFKICEAGSKKICISSDGYILPCEVFKQNRFDFMNIHAISTDQLFTMFRKLSSIQVLTEGAQGCLKKEVHRLSMGGV